MPMELNGVEKVQVPSVILVPSVCNPQKPSLQVKVVCCFAGPLNWQPGWQVSSIVGGLMMRRKNYSRWEQITVYPNFRLHSGSSGWNAFQSKPNSVSQWQPTWMKP